MPTHEEEPGFWRDWTLLSQSQRTVFLMAVGKFTADLASGKGFRPGLRVKGVQGYSGVYVMTWASDGRATFSYGASIQPGNAHIIWRRVGSHNILKNP